MRTLYAQNDCYVYIFIWSVGSIFMPKYPSIKNYHIVTNKIEYLVLRTSRSHLETDLLFKMHGMCMQCSIIQCHHAYLAIWGSENQTRVIKFDT